MENIDTTQIKLRPGAEWSPTEKERIFDGLYQKSTMARYVGLAYGFTGDLPTAEQVVTKKYTDAYKYIHTYDPGRYRGKNKCPFDNWMSSIIARDAKTAGKKLANRPQIEPLDGTEFRHPNPNPMSEEMVWESVAPLLDKLTPVERTAITLYDKDGKSYEEIAAKMGSNEDAVRVYVCRARKKLQDWLREEE